jgi:hypothetical protein
MLRFHARTFDLLGIAPSVSPTAVEFLGQLETKIGCPLPSSVREWYELLGACRILLEYSNDDPPVEILHLGEPRTASRGGGPHNLIARNLLVFRVENQGVCTWAICLDGSDDPPVVVDVDTQFSTWTRCADSFSQHVYSWVWDYAWIMGPSHSNDLLIQTQNLLFSQNTLDFLKNHFQAELVTYGWPGATQYRFFSQDQRILIWVDEGYANWFLAASSEDALMNLVSKLGPLDGLHGAMFSHTPAVQKALERLRVGR